MSSSVCIITARSGSKRIPRKNIREFCGRPIIAYSIEAALESGLFDEVMVSTDDEEIAGIARQYGAAVPFMRSAEASDDFANTSDVLAEVLAEYREHGKDFEVVCCLYPTAPFVSARELRDAAALLEDSGAPSIISVTGFDYPPQRAFSMGEDGALSYERPEYALARSQDLPRLVHDCGMFYIARTEAFEAAGSLVMEGSKALYIPAEAVQDIDTEEDWAIAEMKFKVLTGARE